MNNPMHRVCDTLLTRKSDDVLWLERRIGRCDEINAKSTREAGLPNKQPASDQ